MCGGEGKKEIKKNRFFFGGNSSSSDFLQLNILSLPKSLRESEVPLMLSVWKDKTVERKCMNVWAKSDI